MSIRYSDAEIEALIAEEKRLPADFRESIRFRDKGASEEYDCTVTGVDGAVFQLRLRRSKVNRWDFSAILAACPAGTNVVFRLCRYNGKSHEHSNRLEGERFYDYHIHRATQRYQAAGPKEDTFAERTNRFCDLWAALDCLLDDCGFVVEAGPQPRLLDSGRGDRDDD